MLKFLERLASSFWETIRRVVGLLIPFLAKAPDFRGVGRGLRWALAFVVLAGVLIALGWVNQRFHLDAWLPSAPVVRGIHTGDYWLPLLVLLVYILIWLGWWLWKLLGPEAETSDFPDIDEAWDDALRALNQAGIDVREPPLFLVLGQPLGTEAALLEGAQLQLKVPYAPNRASAPLHVYANRDGVYVTCAGASLLGRQAAILAGEADPGLDGDVNGAAGGAGGAANDPFKTLQPQGRLRDVQGVLQRAREQGRAPDQLTEEEKNEIQRLIAEEEAEHARKVAKPRPVLLKNAPEVARLTARLKHLCRLIVRDRHPYCPVNGIFVLINFAATDSNEDANQTGAVCQQDLAAARQVLQVHCPLLALVCDLETAPGFREFIGRFPSEQRQRRVGQHFPLVPDLREGESVLDLIERSVQWICSSLFPTWIHKLFRVESSGGEDFETVVRGNTRLYQLLCEVRDRRKRLSSVFVRGLATDNGRPWMFGGCYLASTSRNVAQEQAFVPGVFRKLIDYQNYVSWTEEAVQGEENYQRWTRYGYVAIFAGALALAGLLYLAVQLHAR